MKSSKLVRIHADKRYDQDLTPENLHNVLVPTHTVIVTFKGEKQMNQYRRMLYTINRQGSFRYRTIRDEGSMWGLVIWRMK